MLKSICVSCAMSIVSFAAYWISGCSVISWFSVLQSVMKAQVRAVVKEVVLVLGPAVGSWPSFCVLLSIISSGHSFVSYFWVMLVSSE